MTPKMVGQYNDFVSKDWTPFLHWFCIRLVLSNVLECHIGLIKLSTRERKLELMPTKYIL